MSQGSTFPWVAQYFVSVLIEIFSKLSRVFVISHQFISRDHTPRGLSKRFPSSYGCYYNLYFSIYHKFISIYPLYIISFILTISFTFGVIHGLGIKIVFVALGIIALYDVFEMLPQHDVWV